MAETLFPNIDIILQLSHLSHIKNLRTTVWEISKTLACHQLGRTKQWKHSYTEEMQHQESSLVNIVVLMIADDDNLKTNSLNAAIISKDV